MSTVFFKEKDHRYINSSKVPYESVSGLWKPYFKPFDAESIAVKKAYKELDLETYNKCKQVLGYEHDKFIDMLKFGSEVSIDIVKSLAQTYIDSWSDKSELGTKFHLKEELKDRDRGFRVNDYDSKEYPIVTWKIKKGYDNQSYPGNLSDIPDGYITEHLVKSDLHKVAGQADQVFIETVNGVRYVDINDWKTDREILVKPDFFHPKKGYEKLLHPMDHLYETNLWKYCLKISTYAKFFEMEGFTVRTLGFTHVVLDDLLEITEKTLYKVPYKSFEVDISLAERLKSL